MSESTATEHPADPFRLLPKAIYRAIVADLYTDIPPPALTDPELITERVHAAIGEIASMFPVSARWTPNGGAWNKRGVIPRRGRP
jgi:hypothetical protein